jgi:hypothetical protein
MDIYEIVKKLTGDISPIGDTDVDNNRFRNMKILMELTDKLIEDLCDVARHEKNKVAFSRKRAGELAHDFLGSIGITDY